MTDYVPLLTHIKQIGIEPQITEIDGIKCIVIPVHEIIAGELNVVADLAARRTGKPIDKVRKQIMDKLTEKVKDGQLLKYSDPAMFLAQPITSDGPHVQLVTATPDPLGVIALCAKGYQGKFSGDTEAITDDDRRHYLDDVRKNVLAAPLEFVHFVFRIEGVTRGFTHQLVRQRTATYVQESTRFAVKEGVPVAYPPSLAGTESWDEYESDCQATLYPQGLAWDDDERQEQVFQYAWEHASDAQKWRRHWDIAVGTIAKEYHYLINRGMPAEDARGLLPTNLKTQVYYNTDLRHLMDHAGLRLCSQAQFEWRTVWAEMLKAIRAYGDDQFYDRPGEPLDVEDWHGQYHAGWQFNAIADLFKPICYRTGKCEFMSEGDRYCEIRERVQRNAESGIKPENWDHENISKTTHLRIAAIDLQRDLIENPRAAMEV